MDQYYSLNGKYNATQDSMESEQSRNLSMGMFPDESFNRNDYRDENVKSYSYSNAAKRQNSDPPHYQPMYKRKMQTSYLSDKRNLFNLTALKGENIMSDVGGSDYISKQFNDITNQNNFTSVSRPNSHSNDRWMPHVNNANHEWVPACRSNIHWTDTVMENKYQDTENCDANNFSNGCEQSCTSSKDEHSCKQRPVDDGNDETKNSENARDDSERLCWRDNTSVDFRFGGKAKEKQGKRIFDSGWKGNESNSQGNRVFDMGLNTDHSNPLMDISPDEPIDVGLQTNESGKSRDKERIKHLFIHHTNKSVTQKHPLNSFPKNNVGPVPVASFNSQLHTNYIEDGRNHVNTKVCGTGVRNVHLNRARSLATSCVQSSHFASSNNDILYNNKPISHVNAENTTGKCLSANETINSLNTKATCNKTCSDVTVPSPTTTDETNIDKNIISSVVANHVVTSTVNAVVKITSCDVENETVNSAHTTVTVNSSTQVSAPAKVADSTAKVVPVCGKAPVKGAVSSHTTTNVISITSKKSSCIVEPIVTTVCSTPIVSRRLVVVNTTAGVGARKHSTVSTGRPNVINRHINNISRLNLPTGIVAPYSTLDITSSENILKTALSKVQSFTNLSKPVNIVNNHLLSPNPIINPILNPLRPSRNPIIKPIIPALNPVLNAAARLNSSLLLRANLLSAPLLRHPVLNNLAIPYQNTPLHMNHNLPRGILTNNIQTVVQNLLQRGALQGRFRFS